MDTYGVVARWQLREQGLRDHDIRRLLRRRELFVAAPGVYIRHNGPRDWTERAWIAVLAAWPAVLAGPSALRADGVDVRGERLHLAVDHQRRLSPRDGIVIHRRRDVIGRARLHLSPPRVAVEEAALDVALAGAPLDAVAVLAKVCGARLTTPARLRTELERRPRVRDRPWLLGVLGDIDNGTHSVLEHGYLVRVERPHGLPAAQRQRVVATGSGRRYRDVDYGPILVELDGRQHGETKADDLTRDLDAAVSGQATIRLGWKHVFGEACATADRVAALLQRFGWTGRPDRCGQRCVVGRNAAIW
ncbi:hypothetical protein EHW97_00275 [Aeromicrobium camelliae]|uniref:Type IV toxin-antitoxin system AbiEi family antitoxin domain-containing protein n=1 Tax=Aeromicrobium camelliae TaxID=1538144 RepID=A0A3N6X8J5_9ACTN|nr:hypothetical protein [Aeromicrobium camelliae]RQN09973.1 hypothetical protein EHW97_00275 [Aeromicrobium camelliae]